MYNTIQKSVIAKIFLSFFFFFKVCFAHQGWIYMIKNTVKIKTLWIIITVQNKDSFQDSLINSLHCQFD